MQIEVSLLNLCPYTLISSSLEKRIKEEEKISREIHITHWNSERGIIIRKVKEMWTFSKLSDQMLVIQSLDCVVYDVLRKKTVSALISVLQRAHVIKLGI